MEVPPEGWHVEVDHPDGVTRSPEIRDSAQALPRLNGLPEVRIPVRAADYWTDADWERQPMRVWRDGHRLPITQLAEVREAPDGVELIGKGGLARISGSNDDLRQVIEREYSDEDGHTVIREVLDEVGIAHTIDPAPVDENQLVASLSSTPEFESLATNAAPGGPAVIANDEVRPAITCQIVPPSQIDQNKIVGDTSTNWTSTEAVEIDVTDEPFTSKASFDIDLDYDLASDDYEIYIRGGTDFTGSIDVEIGGEPAGDIFRSSLDGRSGTKDVQWQEVTFSGSGSPPDLSGTVTVDIFTASGGDSASGVFYIDCFTIYDTQFWDGSNFVNTLNANNKLNGGPPGLYAPTPADFAAEPILRATGARLEASLSSTANGQALEIIRDGTRAIDSNADTFEFDFSDSRNSFIGRVRLDGVDATTVDSDVETEVTTYRTEPQVLSSLTIKYDALNSPTVSRPVEDRAIDIINELADRVDLLWELQWDESIGGLRFVGALPGQRTSDSDPSLAEYQVRKSIEEELSRAVVRGRTLRVTAESFEADINQVGLNNDRIKTDSERVYDPDTGEEFDRGDDYQMEYLLGNIELVPGSSMTDGEIYQIDYEEKSRGEDFQSGNLDFQNPRVVDITAFTTDAECEEAAAFLIDQNNTPLWTATVTIPRQEAGFDLIDELDPSRLPSPPNGGYRLKSIDESPQEITLSLGSRSTVAESVQRIRSSVSRTQRDV